MWSPICPPSRNNAATRGEKTMNINRRQALGLTAGAAVFAAAGVRTMPALADAAATEEAIKAFTGGVIPEGAGKLTLDAPEIAENGNTVPISVSVESAMT